MPRPGTVAVTGTLGVLQGGWPLDLKFTARNAQPFASSIVSGNVNADLTLTGTLLHELTLAGNIQINRAAVQIPNSFPPNVAGTGCTSARRQARRQQQQQQPSDQSEGVGERARQILVRGRGLDAELGGRVQIGGTARRPPSMAVLICSAGCLRSRAAA